VKRDLRTSSQTAWLKPDPLHPSSRSWLHCQGIPPRGILSVMKKIELQIDGMSCDHCVASVKRALAAVPGVSNTDVRIGAATLTVDPEQATIGALIDAVQDAGYEAREGS